MNAKEQLRALGWKVDIIEQVNKPIDAYWQALLLGWLAFRTGKRKK